jgi:hypothetical protein
VLLVRVWFLFLNNSYFSTILSFIPTLLGWMLDGDSIDFFGNAEVMTFWRLALRGGMSTLVSVVDGCRAKIGDIQLEVNEDFLSLATGLPAEGQRWFKNLKVDEVPWPLLFTSRKINNCDKGMPVIALKSRWHDLLTIIKQFVTCEGRYGLVFLYHLWLLMSFIDFPLNMPHFLLRSLYKMAKHFKREKADSSLFHHCLIKIIVVH